MSRQQEYHNKMDFCPQVDRLMIAAGVTRVVDLARIIGENPNVISNWNSRKKIPADKILKSSQIVGCSAEWVETGKGEMHPGHGYNRESAADYATTNDKFDWDLHNEIATMIGEAQEKLKIRIKPDKLGGIIQMIYNDHLAGVQATPAKVIQLVRLAA